MKLEDAFLYVVFDNGWAGDELIEACRQAVSGGADILQIAAGAGTPVEPDTARRAADLCREEEALLLLRDNAGLAREMGAAGVHLEKHDTAMGMVRAALGNDCIVGMTSHTVDGARLALEIGADYLLHQAGRNCSIEFAALKGEARVPLFAAGLEGLEDAVFLVAGGVFRLCVKASRLERADLGESIARYARLLGRCL